MRDCGLNCFYKHINIPFPHFLCLLPHHFMCMMLWFTVAWIYESYHIFHFRSLQKPEQILISNVFMLCIWASAHGGKVSLNCMIEIICIQVWWKPNKQHVTAQKQVFMSLPSLKQLDILLTFGDTDFNCCKKSLSSVAVASAGRRQQTPAYAQCFCSTHICLVLLKTPICMMVDHAHGIHGPKQQQALLKAYKWTSLSLDLWT